MSGQEKVELTGRVQRLTFHNPENGYTVAKVQVSGQPDLVTLVGPMPGVVEGQEVVCTGRRTSHPKFGPQVEVETCRVRPPSDLEGVKRYLSSGMIKGVGPVLAERIVETLGPAAIEVILAQPEALDRVPGIGRKKAKSIAGAVAEHGALRELMVFLQAHGVGGATVLKIFREYGATALEVVREEPHRLAGDIRGIGFATADQIAAKVGIAHDHPTRLIAGLKYVLRLALDEGHVFLPYETLMEDTARELRVERASLGPAFARLHELRQIVLQETGDGERAVYLTGQQVQEDRTAHEVARLSRQPGLLTPERADKAVEWVAGRLSFRPSRAQSSALADLLSAGMGVLTGGPGTGKTTLVRALIQVALRMGLSVALAAPTGRAAKRLGESAGLPASTLHRLLEYAPKENRFLRGRDKPLEAQLVVVDESSMIDAWLGCHLSEAVGPESRLVLVGDADQLPPVGPGLFFKQVMASGAAHVARLTEIFRQDEAGLIVTNAHRILHGRMPRLPLKGQAGDFFFLEEDDPAAASGLVRDLVARRLPDSFGLDPNGDIQVLSPMHKGHLGCAQLNRLLRQALNPTAGEGALGRGDKVMQVRNNYDLDVFNGDVGRVEAKDDDGLLVRLDNRLVRYAPSDADDLTLAYAVTIHKAQGSEYPAVVIPVATEHFIMLNRPLLYTAVTRGKRLVVLVGQKRALARAVEHVEPIRRNARLDKKIRALLENTD